MCPWSAVRLQAKSLAKAATMPIVQRGQSQTTTCLTHMLKPSRHERIVQAELVFYISGQVDKSVVSWKFWVQNLELRAEGVLLGLKI